jgi:uncharacterized protein with FMN-binding domain
MPDHETEQAAGKTRNTLLLCTALIVVSGVYPGPASAMEADTIGPPTQNFIEFVAANAAQSLGHYNDGEFIGKSAGTIWGEVQVKALIHDGSIIDVQFLQYPSHRRRSALISGWAMPILRSEAIRAQSAGVDMVSQASITAEGFQKSLASALIQATK